MRGRGPLMGAAGAIEMRLSIGGKNPEVSWIILERSERFCSFHRYCFFSVADRNVFEMTERIKSFRSKCLKI